MRHLKLQMQITVDGFVADFNGELDWMIWEWDDPLKEYVKKLTKSVDTILLGRKMTEGFISHWSAVANNPEDPEYLDGKMYMDIPKIVFSHTMTTSKWKNTTIAQENYIEYINTLKKEKGQDIIVYGGAAFVSSLIKANLIDSYYLFVNPVAIGRGMTIFQSIKERMKLSLIDSRSFQCGIVVLHYELCS